MSERITRHRLQVAADLDRFINEQALPGTGVDESAFWAGVDALFHDLTPKNRQLLEERDTLQEKLDAWHRENPGPVRDMPAYRSFLKEAGYLVDAPNSVKATTANVDREVATQAGPQLVVPVSNARYALNAANIGRSGESSHAQRPLARRLASSGRATTPLAPAGTGLPSAGNYALTSLREHHTSMD